MNIFRFDLNGYRKILSNKSALNYFLTHCLSGSYLSNIGHFPFRLLQRRTDGSCDWSRARLQWRSVMVGDELGRRRANPCGVGAGWNEGSEASLEGLRAAAATTAALGSGVPEEAMGGGMPA